jgi:hypothetical protein
MAFSNAVLAESAGLGSGELLPNTNGLTLSFDTFEDGLVQGRFCKYDAGSIDNLDASTTPQIAGISRRLISGEIGVSTYRTTGDIPNSVAEVVTTGMCTVDVVNGDTPAKYGTAYAVNTATADSGKATTTSTSNVDSGWVFWKEVAANVWLVVKKELVA